jgi:hypothetical protein
MSILFTIYKTRQRSRSITSLTGSSLFKVFAGLACIFVEALLFLLFADLALTIVFAFKKGEYIERRKIKKN